MPLMVSAGEKEEQLIGQVTEAYGGDALRNLSSYTNNKKMIASSIGQSRTHELDNLAINNLYLAVDLKNKRARTDTLFDGRGGVFQVATITHGEKAWNLNYQANTYGVAQNADIYVIAGGSMRTNDAVLAYELSKSKDKAKYSGEVDYMNRLHEKIEIPFPSSQDLTLYIDKETHLISRMTRMNPQLGLLDYVFSDMSEHNGIKYALKTDFFIAGVANLITTSNESQFNIDIAPSEFEIPSDMIEEGERTDTSEMEAFRFSDDVYHVGQGGGFSIFINTPEGIIAAGGYPGLVDRLNLFRSKSGNHKRLKYQIVTHHHQDHLGGINEAVDLGANIVTVETHLDAIKSGVVNSGDAIFVKVADKMTFGEGKSRVEIYDVATIHSAHFLVTYVPSQKLVFIADHLNSPYKTGIPTANLNTVTMYEALSKLNLKIKKIAIAHGSRIFTMKEMKQSVDAYKAFGCLDDRPVCM